MEPYDIWGQMTRAAGDQAARDMVQWYNSQTGRGVNYLGREGFPPLDPQKLLGEEYGGWANGAARYNAAYYKPTRTIVSSVDKNPYEPIRGYLSDESVTPVGHELGHDAFKTLSQYPGRYQVYKELAGKMPLWFQGASTLDGPAGYASGGMLGRAIDKMYANRDNPQFAEQQKQNEIDKELLSYTSGLRPKNVSGGQMKLQQGPWRYPAETDNAMEGAPAKYVAAQGDVNQQTLDYYNYPARSAEKEMQKLMMRDFYAPPGKTDKIPFKEVKK